MFVPWAKGVEWKATACCYCNCHPDIPHPLSFDTLDLAPPPIHRQKMHHNDVPGRNVVLCLRCCDLILCHWSQGGSRESWRAKASEAELSPRPLCGGCYERKREEGSKKIEGGGGRGREGREMLCSYGVDWNSAG